MSSIKSKNYDEVTVVRALSRKRGCDISGKTVYVSPDQTDLGNISWGKIDYLRKVHKYTVIHEKTNHYQKKSHTKGVSGEQSNEIATTIIKKAHAAKTGKVNMAAMTKQAMSSLTR